MGDGAHGSTQPKKEDWKLPCMGKTYSKFKDDNRNLHDGEEQESYDENEDASELSWSQIGCSTEQLTDKVPSSTPRKSSKSVLKNIGNKAAALRRSAKAAVNKTCSSLKRKTSSVSSKRSSRNSGEDNFSHDTDVSLNSFLESEKSGSHSENLSSGHVRGIPSSSPNFVLGAETNDDNGTTSKSRRKLKLHKPSRRASECASRKENLPETGKNGNEARSVPILRPEILHAEVESTSSHESAVTVRDNPATVAGKTGGLEISRENSSKSIGQGASPNSDKGPDGNVSQNKEKGQRIRKFTKTRKQMLDKNDSTSTVSNFSKESDGTRPLSTSPTTGLNGSPSPMENSGAESPDVTNAPVTGSPYSLKCSGYLEGLWEPWSYSEVDPPFTIYRASDVRFLHKIIMFQLLFIALLVIIILMK